MNASPRWTVPGPGPMPKGGTGSCWCVVAVCVGGECGGGDVGEFSRMLQPGNPTTTNEKEVSSNWVSSTRLKTLHLRSQLFMK